MSHDRVLRPSLPKSVRNLLTSEISRAFGLWAIAAIICIAISFLWMSMHYDPNRPALAAAKRDSASAALGSAGAP